MKFIVSLLLTALLSFVSGLYLPWWGIAVSAVLVSAFIRQGHGRSFLSAFLGVFFLWGLLAWRLDKENNSILSRKIAQILPLGGSVFFLILLTAFIGALVAGLAGLAGSYMRKAAPADLVS